MRLRKLKSECSLTCKSTAPYMTLRKQNPEDVVQVETAYIYIKPAGDKLKWWENKQRSLEGFILVFHSFFNRI